MARPTKPTTTETTRPATFSLEEVNKIIGEQVLAALAAQKAQFDAMLGEAVQAAKATAKPTSKSDQSSKNEMATIKTFKKKLGIIVKPRVDVLTFNKWVAEGLRPKEGEHAVKVANLRLFHKSQCRPLTKEEAAGFKAKAKEREAKAATKTTATVVNINQPSA